MIGLALVVGAVGFAVASMGEPEFSSTAKVAFIEDTRFDYADAERDRLIGHAEGPDGAEITSRPEISAVDYVRPADETFLDVTVTADDPALAAGAANELATLIVARDLELRLEPLVAETAVLERQITDLEGRIAALEDRIAAATQVEAAAEASRFEGSPDDLERLTIELREAQDSLFVDIRERNSLDDYRVRAERRLDEIESDTAGARARTAVVRPGVEPTERSDIPPWRVALIGALATLGLSAAALLSVRDRRPRTAG